MARKLKVFVVVEERDYRPIIPQNALAAWVATERHLRTHGIPGEATLLRREIEQSIMAILERHAFITDNTLIHYPAEEDDEQTWEI